MSEHIDLAAVEETNRERLLGWWDLISTEPSYPVPSTTVVKLLQAVEYRCDNDTLLGAVADGWIPPVPRQAGRMTWDATSIVALSCALEARRLWQPFSKIHGHKFSFAEKCVQLCNRDGGQPFDDLHQYDFAGLLGILHQVSGDPAAVQVMAEAIRHKLQSEGIV